MFLLHPVDIDEYISKANKQLTEGNLYKKLNEDSTRKQQHCQQHNRKF